MPSTVVEGNNLNISLLVFKTVEQSGKIMGWGNILFRLKSWFYRFLVMWPWAKLPNFLLPQFAYMQNRDEDGIYIIRMSVGWSVQNSRRKIFHNPSVAHGQGFSGFCLAALLVECCALALNLPMAKSPITAWVLELLLWLLGTTSGPITPSLPTSPSQLHGIGYLSITQALGFIFFFRH